MKDLCSLFIKDGARTKKTLVINITNLRLQTEVFSRKLYFHMLERSLICYLKLRILELEVKFINHTFVIFVPDPLRISLCRREAIEVKNFSL